MLRDQDGSAVLYRTVIAGPSGQRKDLAVGRVHYCGDYADVWTFEFEIASPRTGKVMGYARRSTDNGHAGEWNTYAYESWYGDIEYLGRAETLSLAADIVCNGVHEATGRHDSRRVSPVRWTPRKALADRT